MSDSVSQKQNVINKLDKCDANLVNRHLDILWQSDFLIESFYRFPDWLIAIDTRPPQGLDYQYYADWLNQRIANVTSEEQLLSVLRQFRRKILVMICWSQITQTSSTEQTLTQLSTLAETLILAARDWLYQLSCQEWGTPCDHQGHPQPLIILGMGKLGGGELNFSSDIDLIFTYPQHGVTLGGRRELDNAIFFTRLGQRLIKTLDQITQDGFVYRVDMRLRPLGEGGPLVISFSSMEDYYQEQGRDWERYAMVKAKVLGDQHDPYVKELYQMLKPFIYRRYIDFSVLQSLRNMKGMIEREVRRRGLENNIKLGAGGIREVEFIVQVFQLIRGGRVVALQTRSLLDALKVIKQENYLSKVEVTTLHDNYLFLRRCENLLQAINDEQTQTLPNDKLNQARIAIGMGFTTWDDFYQTIQARMLANRIIFNNLIGSDEAEQSQDDREEIFSELWDIDLDIADIKAVLPNLANEEEYQTLYQQIIQFRKDISKRTIGVRGRDILDQLMPRVFALVCQMPNRLTVLPRIFHLLVNIVSRTTYLELLVEYSNALQQLIRLCAASPMISDQLMRYPLLLDELIDFNALYQTVPFEAYKSELYQYLLRVPTDDEEQQVEALRQFKQMQLLHIAAADVAQLLPTMKVSDHLTYLAEAMLDFVVQIAWNQLVKRYGRPDYLTDDTHKGLVVIGYGKLGGLELGYGSDLDLVFLHDCPASSVTTGDKVIDSRQFYLRLVQRIIYLFNIRTNSGILYEVDVRLRPQGDAGLLACTLDSFADYQNNDAWTWEHQALVRSRVVYGEPDLNAKFNQIRRQVLSKQRDPQQLKMAVREMREKMRAHLSQHDGLFNIKVDEGGIGDIEFISQYLVLNYAFTYPEMTIWSDNVRILAAAAQHQLMSSDEANTLTEIYIKMRNEIHGLSLQLLSSKVANTEFVFERDYVKNSWQKWLI